MIKIDYPVPAFKIKTESQQEFIFDTNRKKWVLLTPEEWVRQNFLQYLIQTKKYPASLISVEREINVGELKKRYDVLIYKNDKPWMIIECKEMEVTLSEKTILQILNYNQSLDVAFLIITNGKQTIGIETSTKKYLSIIPEYK
jgi:hypothetical protein